MSLCCSFILSITLLLCFASSILYLWHPAIRFEMIQIIRIKVSFEYIFRILKKDLNVSDQDISHEDISEGD